MKQVKKLIEVAMPIKEISAESVRDKSIRHGHISTLHLWWARRPLPICRAVIFASLVPDPLDDNCPQTFKEAVEILLGKEGNLGDPYHPYLDIPWTAIYDPVEDNLRNRLQMFIGKFTNDMQQALLHHKTIPSANNQLQNRSLIKWDSKNNEEIIKKAQKLIWVAHSCKSDATKISVNELFEDFEIKYKAIKEAESRLYTLENRHIETAVVKEATERMNQAIEIFLERMPTVFDPFAGGGAIPLEAARLGCRSFGNDINPVAHIIQKGSLEFPQKYGKQIVYSKSEFLRLYGQDEWKKFKNEELIYVNGEAVAVKILNRLSFDIEFYTKKLLKIAELEIGHLYPKDKQGNKPIAYYWARVGICNNPTCNAEVPLLKSFYLVNTKTKQIYLKPIIKGVKIDFEIVRGTTELEGWNNRGNLKCPCCGSITDVIKIKQQNIDGGLSERLLAVIIDGKSSKDYRLPTYEEIEVVKTIITPERPAEIMQRNSAGGDTFSWGITKWGQLFSPRQLLTILTLISKLEMIKNELKALENEYAKAIITYLAIFIDRVAIVNTSFGIWHTGRETLERIMGRQAIPMVFDYPESNPFCNSTGSALNQLEWLIRYIESESDQPFSTILQNASSGEKNQFPLKSITAVVTDPPYYDAIAYADISDFFYVWLKRTLAEIYPLNFATPQTPKTEECTALKHHHNGSFESAKLHFENKLLQIFDAIEYQTSEIVSIMFAHQSTEAWSTLCNSILGSRMNITGSWAIDTEMTGALKTDKSYLSSSVTVSCKPSQRNGIGVYKDVSFAIEKTVEKEVEVLYSLGFRGADLLTACFGQAVSEFGKYEKVEKADGSEVTVADLLEMARESAFNSLLKGFDGDDFTKFYIGWLQLYGFAESEFDDAAKFSRVGLSINVQDLFNEHILIKNGNKQTLGGFQDRIHDNKNIGEKSNSFLIDQVHKAMDLYKGTNRGALLEYTNKVASSPESSFWRVITSLCEVLPAASEDFKQANGLLTNKDSLIRESKKSATLEIGQAKLFE